MAGNKGKGYSHEHKVKGLKDYAGSLPASDEERDEANEEWTQREVHKALDVPWHEGKK